MRPAKPPRRRLRDRLASPIMSPRSVVALIVLGCIMLGLTVYGSLVEGFSSFAINMGVEGLVTLSAVAVIGPLVQRSREGGSHIYPRLNHSRFLREVAGARIKTTT